MHESLFPVTFTFIFTLAIASGDTWGDGKTYAVINAGDTAIINLPQVSNYRRIVSDEMWRETEHIYRVCNGKNKKTCGYWENTKTKKKVASGVTTYNKIKKQLIIKKARTSDFAIYMTGNKKTKFELFVM